MYQELPIKMEVIVFQKNKDEYKFLLVKRSHKDGGFWQPITGTLEFSESILDCMKREVFEETGITEGSFTDEIHRFSWQKKDYTVVELVYGLDTTQENVILSEEHTEYRWCDFEVALQLLEKENNKNAFLQFKKRIIESN